MAALSLHATAILDHVSDWRNRLVADAKFQRWAARSPLTRWIARRRARALFDLTAGFVYSQILAACVELDIFERLRGGPKELRTLAAQTGLSPDAGRRLFEAAVSLRLLKKRGGERYALADLGAAIIGNPGVAAFVAHHHLLYADLADPVALLRGARDTNLARFWPYAADLPGRSSTQGAAGDSCAYSALMSQTQALVAEAVLDSYPFERHRRLMDIGGGEGLFLAAASRRAPELGLTLFDLPSVVAHALTKLAGQRLAARIELVGGDCLRDPLPPGADLATLVRVLHDHDDESARIILAAIRAALPQNGALIVAEPMAGAPGAERMGGAYFGFYLLAMGRGRPRTEAEISNLLREAGFARVRRLATADPLIVSALLATFL